MMVLYHYYFKTPKSFPLEYLHLCANESHLLRLDFDTTNFSHNAPMNTPLKLSIQALECYFLGQLFEFNVPLDLIGTFFQKQVWSAWLSLMARQKVTMKSQSSLITLDLAELLATLIAITLFL
ncbi:hypothetical protein HpKG83_12300 [Helicobacter pylori]